MRLPLILAILTLGLLTGCATVIDSTTAEPISDSRGTVSYTHLTLPTICSV